VTPLAGDVFGELSAGTLDITCTGILLGDLIGRDKLIVQGVDQKFECPVFLDSSDEEPSSEVKVHLLPLIGGKTGMGWREKGETEWHYPELIQGMVLRRVGGSAGEFHRIGSFKCEQRRMEDDALGGNSSNQVYHEFVRKLEDSGAELARSICAEVVENAERPKEIFAITVI
jgi:hypothetical protein